MRSYGRKLRPVGLTTRLNHLERQMLPPPESEIQRQSRADLARWLVTDPDAADLIAEYEALCDMHGGHLGVVRIVEGRALLVTMALRIYELPR